MAARPPRELYASVNALSALAVADVLGLEKARGERDKYACPAHGGSDSLHAYKGDGRGFYCFGCSKAFSAVDMAIAAWSIEKEDACQRLADAFGLTASACLPYRLPPASPPARRERPEVVYSSLEAIRAEGIVPQLPSAVYGAIIEGLRLTADGASYLRGRGLDADEAQTYGFRSIDGAREWATLGEQLGAEYLDGELVAANLYRVNESTGAPTWAPPWGGCAPALLMPYMVRGEVVAIQLRDLRPNGDKKMRYRALIPSGAARPPFNADALLDCHGDVLHVCEGELNAFTLMTAGARAVGLKAAVWPEEWTEALRSVRRLVVWFDVDKGSDRKAENFGGMIQERLGSTWIRERTVRVPLPLGDDGKNLDANDLHQRGLLREYIARAAA